MYALPVALLLAAIWADREEAPPPAQAPKPHGGPEGFGSLSRADMVEGYGATLSRAEMVQGYGAEPGSWEAAWHGVQYGADPISARIEAINTQVMKIVKRILGWAVATKGPKLISLNSQRDALIKQGVPPNSPQVSALENQAFAILQAAGLQPGSSEYQTLQHLGAKRDQLIRKQAGLA